MTPEQKRRLDALENATRHITICENDFDWSETDCYEPFSESPWTNVSGEVNVIYDRSGNVERIVRHDLEANCVVYEMDKAS